MSKTSKSLIWEQVEKKKIFENPFITIRNDIAKRPDNKKVEYAVVEHKDFICSLCINTKNEIVLVKQFRYPWDTISLENPSGLINKNETAIEAAKREILEETGYITEHIIQLGKKYHPVGFGSGWGYLFLSRVKDHTHQILDDNEFIVIKTMTITDFNGLIETGEIIHGATIFCWLAAKAKGYV